MTGRVGEKRCGTTSGWTRHQDRGEKPCDACARAKQEYDKRWRLSDIQTKKSRARAAAQWRAVKRLQEAHAEEFRRLYQEELDKIPWELRSSKQQKVTKWLA